MKTVIIVDDYENKRKDIKESLTRFFGKDTIFKEYEYFNKAIREILEMKDEINSNPENYLLILDMCFPHLSDTMPETDMGLHFLFNLKRRNINIPVIMCSSEEIDESLLVEYDNILGSVEYDSSVLLTFDDILKK